MRLRRRWLLITETWYRIAQTRDTNWLWLNAETRNDWVGGRLVHQAGYAAYGCSLGQRRPHSDLTESISLAWS